MTRFREKNFAEGAKSRLKLLCGVAVIFWLVLIGRLIQLQLLERGEFKSYAQSQNFWQVKRSAPRGVIFDRQGTKLAYDISTRSFFAVPDSIANHSEVASRFSLKFGGNYHSLLENLQSEKKFVWLARQLEVPQVEQVQSWGFSGVYIREEPKRINPLGGIGKAMLGATDVDSRGISGLELYLDSILSGEPGWEILQRDALGRVYEIKEYVGKPAIPGRNVVLTLDAQLQWILENRLQQGIEKTRSNSGYGIFLDPHTGEILACASLANPVTGNAESLNKIRAITDQFEPGSTIKIVTAAAALEEGIKKPTDVIYAEEGKWKVGIGKHIIRDIHEYGNITFEQGMAYSSNIAIAKVGVGVGGEKLYKYLRNFGFGFQTGVALPGEAAGVVLPLKEWGKINVISNSIGYGLSTTALQLVCAYAAVANGGWLLQPRLVEAVLDSGGKILQEFSSRPLRRVISQKTAETLTNFFRLSVEEGTSMPARIPGVDLCGKTGTARKAKIGSKGYQDAYLSSFVGYFPGEEPRYIGIIILDNPKGMMYGGQTAAPVFKEIVKDILSLPNSPTHQLIKPDQLAEASLDSKTIPVSARKNDKSSKATKALVKEL